MDNTLYLLGYIHKALVQTAIGQTKYIPRDSAISNGYILVYRVLSP